MKLLPLASVLGVLLGVGVWMWSRIGDVPRPASQDASLIGLAVSAKPACVSRARGPVSPPRRSLRSELRERRARPDARRVHVRGRCIDAEHGTPLVGVAVDLAVVQRRLGRRIPGDRRIPATLRLRTDCAGEFAAELSVVPPHSVPCGESPRAFRGPWPSLEIRIRTSMAGRATMQGFVPAVQNRVDVGEIEIPSGAGLTAQVLDRERNPRPHATLGLELSDAEREGHGLLAPVDYVEVTTDGSGRLESPVALVAGEWTVVPPSGFTLIRPSTLVIPKSGPSLQSEIVVLAMDLEKTISGSLVDQRGRPIPSIEIRALSAEGRVVGQGRTDSRGSFRIAPPAGFHQPVQLIVDRAYGFEPWGSSGLYPWRSRNVLVRLASAADLEIRVVAAREGGPIEDFGVVWFFRSRNGAWETGGRQPVMHHPGGTTVLRAVPTVPIRIVVQPRDTAFAPTHSQEFLKPPGAATLCIELERCVAIPVVIVDTTRAPVASTQVQLVRCVAGRPIAPHPRRLAGPGLGDPCLLDTAQTDAAGRATLHGRADDSGLAIGVLGPSHVPIVHPVGRRRSHETVEIVVSRGATVRGKVTPVDVLDHWTRPRDRRRAWSGQLSIELACRGAVPEDRCRHTALVERDGSFVIQGLSAGSWNVLLRVWRLGDRDGEGTRLVSPAIHLRPGQERRLVIDLHTARRTDGMPRRNL